MLVWLEHLRSPCTHGSIGPHRYGHHLSSPPRCTPRPPSTEPPSTTPSRATTSPTPTALLPHGPVAGRWQRSADPSSGAVCTQPTKATTSPDPRPHRTALCSKHSNCKQRCIPALEWMGLGWGSSARRQPRHLSSDAAGRSSWGTPDPEWLGLPSESSARRQTVVRAQRHSALWVARRAHHVEQCVELQQRHAVRQQGDGGSLGAGGTGGRGGGAWRPHGR